MFGVQYWWGDSEIIFLLHLYLFFDETICTYSDVKTRILLNNDILKKVLLENV